MLELFARLFEIMLIAAVPGYILLQVIALVRLEPEWKLAALAPLLVMLPVGGHALYALAHNSNLWMIVVTFTSPFACLYLVGLFAIRRFSPGAGKHLPEVEDPATALENDDERPARE